MDAQPQDRKHKLFVWGMVLAWIPAIPILYWVIIVVSAFHQTRCERNGDISTTTGDRGAPLPILESRKFLNAPPGRLSKLRRDQLCEFFASGEPDRFEPAV